jgi:hypothetical protein
VFGPP